MHSYMLFLFMEAIIKEENRFMKYAMIIVTIVTKTQSNTQIPVVPNNLTGPTQNICEKM